MNRTVAIVAIIIILIVGGIALAKKGDNTTTQSNNNPPATSSQNSTNNSNTSSTQPANTQTITYDNNGFSPQKLTARSGDKIVIQNKSNHSVEFSSDPHPAHTDDPELNQETLAPGQQQDFTVTTKGTFGFHNHLNPNERGTIVIQ